MTIADFTKQLQDNKPIAGLTDAQQREVKTLFDNGHTYDAWQKAMAYLEPKARRTLL